MAEQITAFERRRRRIKIHRRDLVQFRCGPQLADRLALLEQELVSEVSTIDPECADFLEWYADEAKKYGVAIRPGLAALYWKTARFEGTSVTLTPELFAAARDEIAEGLNPEVFDDELFTGRYLVQEFIWWSAGDWILQDHLVTGIEEFRDYAARGYMKDWRRRKRRRLAAARRKLIKQLYFAPLRRPLRVERDETDEEEAA